MSPPDHKGHFIQVVPHAQTGPLCLGAPSAKGAPSHASLLLVSAEGTQDWVPPCTGNEVQLDLMCYPTIMLPALYMYHGRRCDCVDHALDPIASLPTHVDGELHCSLLKAVGKITI